MMTAREIVLGLPDRFRQDDMDPFEGIIHLKIKGDEGGEFTVTISDNKCTVTEGLTGEADCVVKTSDKTYVDTEYGRNNPGMAVMMGKIKVSNLGVLMKFINMFRRLS